MLWDRPDRNFFAAGACHILAFVAAELDGWRGEIATLVPSTGHRGLHTYYRVDDRAFDFNGWSDEAELLDATRADYRIADPSWEADVVLTDLDLAGYCERFPVRARGDYDADPWARADAYARRAGLVPSA